MAVRMLIPLLALVLALPAAALAQGAGDEQYQDPFGEEQTQQEPAPTATPEPEPEPEQGPSSPAPSQAAPAPTATPSPPAPSPTAATGDQLPYTGADAGLLALAGALLLGAGVALRRRAEPGR